MTVFTSCVVNGVGRGSVLSRLSVSTSSHSTVGALVPWKGSSACSSGSPVSSPDDFQSGGTARVAALKSDVANFEAVKRVVRVRESRKLRQCWPLVS